MLNKVVDLNQPMYECPFCDTPAYRTRYMLWKHIHECIRKIQTNAAVGIHKDHVPDVTFSS